MERSTNREKVIKGLEICTKDIPMSNAVHKSDFCKECPYYNAENRYCWNQIVMMRDALALMKEQEAVVRCISCTFYRSDGQCALHDGRWKPEGFCSWAIRKEGR